MPPFFVGAGQFSPVSGAVRGAAAGAQSAPGPGAKPRAGFAGTARKTPPPPRASTYAGGGAYPKSHRVKLLPQKRKKVANRHFFAMRYP